MRSFTITEFRDLHAVPHTRASTSESLWWSEPLPLHPTISVKPREERALAQVTQGVHEQWLFPEPHPGLQTLRFSAQYPQPPAHASSGSPACGKGTVRGHLRMVHGLHSLVTDTGGGFCLPLLPSGTYLQGISPT